MWYHCLSKYFPQWLVHCRLVRQSVMHLCQDIHILCIMPCCLDWFLFLVWLFGYQGLICWLFRIVKTAWCSLLSTCLCVAVPLNSSYKWVQMFILFLIRYFTWHISVYESTNVFIFVGWNRCSFHHDNVSMTIAALLKLYPIWIMYYLSKRLRWSKEYNVEEELQTVTCCCNWIWSKKITILIPCHLLNIIIWQCSSLLSSNGLQCVHPKDKLKTELQRMWRCQTA